MQEKTKTKWKKKNGKNIKKDQNIDLKVHLYLFFKKKFKKFKLKFLDCIENFLTIYAN